MNAGEKNTFMLEKLLFCFDCESHSIRIIDDRNDAFFSYDSDDDSCGGWDDWSNYYFDIDHLFNARDCHFYNLDYTNNEIPVPAYLIKPQGDQKNGLF